MKRVLILLFGATSYAGFLGVFLYMIGFVGGFVTPTRLDGELRGPIGEALVINLLLAAVFALQHSGMARPGFKRWWTGAAPAAIERSGYVLASNLVLVLVFWQWRPIGGLVWELQHPAARGAAWMLFAVGWLTVLATTCLINHFDLFGLRQVWLYFRHRPYTELKFVTPGPYRLVRHPMYVGWLLAFWATPRMTVAHLVFAILMTAYILTAIRFEERDLMTVHDRYADYRRRVPMLIPRLPLVRAKPVSSSLSGDGSSRSEKLRSV